jgi:hypothetical protein
MTAIKFPDLVDDRADVLQSKGLNGLKLALVSLPAGVSPDHTDIDLRFFNGLHVAAILADIGGDPVRARQVFRIRGGSRIVAGSSSGQVRVTAVTGIDATRLALRVEPVGDYSTYTLELIWNASLIDPFFSAIGFKFRPGCFTNDCAPVQAARPRAESGDRLPGQGLRLVPPHADGGDGRARAGLGQHERSRPRSGADRLFAAAADELSDFQDRVMAEAYLATARKRVSLARHARLVDYHLHEGNQASTWLAVDVVGGQAPFTLDDQELVASTGDDPPGADAVFLRAASAVFLRSRVNGWIRCSTGCGCTRGAARSRRWPPAVRAPTSRRPPVSHRRPMRRAARPAWKRPVARDAHRGGAQPLTGAARPASREAAASPIARRE